MCRLFGIIKLAGYNQAQDTNIINIFEQMAKKASIGNSSATGVMTIINKKIAYVKAGTDATAFLNAPEWSSFKARVNKMRFICGHTRLATHGNSDDNNNNHPVHDETSPSVAVTHNGVISNHKELATSEGLTLKYEVDTEILLRLYLKYRNIKKVVKDINGSFNFVILDTKNPNVVKIFKHEARGLTLAYVPTLNILIYASDVDIIKEGLSKTILNFFVTIPKFYTRDLDDSHEYTIDITKTPDTAISFEKHDVKKYVKQYYNDAKDTYKSLPAPASGGLQFPEYSPVSRFTTYPFENLLEPEADEKKVSFLCSPKVTRALSIKIKEWKSLITSKSIVKFTDDDLYKITLCPIIGSKKSGIRKIAGLLIDFDKKLTTKKIEDAKHIDVWDVFATKPNKD